MKNLLRLIVFLIFSIKTFGQQSEDSEFKRVIPQWFSAWSLVYTDIYKVDEIQPVQFVFFDDQYVYSTSSVTIPEGISIKGFDLLNLKLNWKKAPHHNLITLPDKTSVPVKIMSFAAEIPTGQHQAFFVMPLPSFWKKMGIESKELGLDNLTTGIFLHEFSHSQQMKNFGKKITQFEKENESGADVNDDMVQNIFSKDNTYVDLYQSEIDHFYNSVIGKELDRKYVSKGINLYNERQKNYFKDKYRQLVKMDDIFLTMEGLGQYSMYRWLIHPQGGNLDEHTALAGVRRNKKWWSQEEGLALFLILERIKNPKFWAKDMFGSEMTTAIELIRSNMQ